MSASPPRETCPKQKRAATAGTLANIQRRLSPSHGGDVPKKERRGENFLRFNFSLPSCLPEEDSCSPQIICRMVPGFS